MNHLHHYWNRRMLTIAQITFCNHCAQWLSLTDERFVINESVAVAIIFFGLGVTNHAANLIASVQ